tara:strand:+ start:1285 stop:1494 length:210 start_codon:yes stop_codon:yes gene_type:complete
MNVPQPLPKSSVDLQSPSFDVAYDHIGLLSTDVSEGEIYAPEIHARGFKSLRLFSADQLTRSREPSRTV